MALGGIKLTSQLCHIHFFCNSSYVDFSCPYWSILGRCGERSGLLGVLRCVEKSGLLGVLRGWLSTGVALIGLLGNTPAVVQQGYSQGVEHVLWCMQQAFWGFTGYATTCVP